MMDQPGLFGAKNNASDSRSHPNFGDFGHSVEFASSFKSWQACARKLLEQQRPPDSIWWQPRLEITEPPELTSQTRGSKQRVPRRFVELARRACLHSNDDRWSLLYSILWRLTHDEPHLLELAGDSEVVRLHKYVSAVNRDVHKMKAFVRFRELKEDRDTETPRFVAWFEPTHHALAPAARFFRDRFPTMRWSILTPNRCAHWEGLGKGRGELWFSSGVDKAMAPLNDNFEEAWRTYYASIFNPARMKLAAMRSEMPQKYWKNLPEAHLIGELIQQAPARVEAMQRAAQEQQTQELNCGPLPETPEDQLLATQNDKTASPLNLLSRAAVSCTTCPLWKPATQTVFGEGPENAKIMLLGEQPGDSEDLQGRPFVGPAGQLLDKALLQAGLDRRSLYLTNTVKHFKFQIRDSYKKGAGGKVRIHKSPSVAETEACRAWLEAELDIVQPNIVVCLGATAARSQLGPGIKIKDSRGQWFERYGRHYLVTLHPSFVLRQQQQDNKAQMFALLVNDLASAMQLERSGVADNHHAGTSTH